MGGGWKPVTRGRPDGSASAAPDPRADEREPGHGARPERVGEPGADVGDGSIAARLDTIVVSEIGGAWAPEIPPASDVRR